MIIVPPGLQIREQENVAQEFFRRIFNPEHSDDFNDQAERTVNALLAISSFGNIVVMTYTAARMKQEIAKQGFIPFSRFFAKDKDFSLARLLDWLEGGQRRSARQSSELDQHGSKAQPERSRTRWLRKLNPSNHRERTPVGALMLHFASCIVLIYATYGMSADHAYGLLSGLIAYLTTAWFGCFLALGILILHFRGPPTTQSVRTPDHPGTPNQGPVKATWKDMIQGTVNAKLGILCGFTYLIGNLYPVIGSWVKPASGALDPWYLVPLVSWCVLAFSALWFLGFLGVAEYGGFFWGPAKQFTRSVEPEFYPADKTDDGRDALLLKREIIYMSWESKETPELMRQGWHGNADPERGSAHPGAPYSGTDFEDLRGNMPAAQNPAQDEHLGGRQSPTSFPQSDAYLGNDFSELGLSGQSNSNTANQSLDGTQQNLRHEDEEPLPRRRDPLARRPVASSTSETRRGGDGFNGTDFDDFGRNSNFA